MIVALLTTRPGRGMRAIELHNVRPETTINEVSHLLNMTDSVDKVAVVDSSVEFRLKPGHGKFTDIEDHLINRLLFTELLHGDIAVMYFDTAEKRHTLRFSNTNTGELAMYTDALNSIEGVEVQQYGTDAIALKIRNSYETLVKMVLVCVSTMSIALEQSRKQPQRMPFLTKNEQSVLDKIDEDLADAMNDPFFQGPTEEDQEIFRRLEEDLGIDADSVIADETATSDMPEWLGDYIIEIDEGLADIIRETEQKVRELFTRVDDHVEDLIDKATDTAVEEIPKIAARLVSSIINMSRKR